MDELGKLLPRFLNKHVRGDQAPVLEVLTPLWTRVAGKAMAEQSRPVAFGNGTVTLAASSAAWATELRGLHDEIRSAINRTLGRPLVKRIRVKLAPALSSGAGCDAVATPSHAPPGNPALQVLRMPVERPTFIAAEKELGLQEGLDPEIGEILLRSFAKYFGRANRGVN